MMPKVKYPTLLAAEMWRTLVGMGESMLVRITDIF